MVRRMRAPTHRGWLGVKVSETRQLVRKIV